MHIHATVPSTCAQKPEKQLCPVGQPFAVRYLGTLGSYVAAHGCLAMDMQGHRTVNRISICSIPPMYSRKALHPGLRQNRHLQLPGCECLYLLAVTVCVPG